MARCGTAAGCGQGGTASGRRHNQPCSTINQPRLAKGRLECLVAIIIIISSYIFGIYNTQECVSHVWNGRPPGPGRHTGYRGHPEKTARPASRSTSPTWKWEPLLLTLQHGQAVAVQCHHCQPAEPLRLLSINRSGSGAEGLSDRIIGGDNYDTMLESNGHFRWAADCISPEAAPQLWPKPTGSPGFVTLP